MQNRFSVGVPLSLPVIAVVVIGIITALLTNYRPGLAERRMLPNLFPFPNASGILQTFNKNGDVDLAGPFFENLGTNGRSCASCHQPDQGWTISAEGAQARFVRTQGLDPLFRTNDGSNCNHHVDTSTVEGRRQAYSLLITRGLIRIPLHVPETAEFEVIGVNNPYQCSETDVLSVYRRPLPSTNLRFLSAVMWDGRESSPQTGTQKIQYETENPGPILVQDLAHQSVDATLGHAQGAVPLPSGKQQAIVNFELGLFTAQVYQFKAGPLYGLTGGGPISLANQQFYVGINDPIDPLNERINRPDLGFNPFHDGFTPVVFKLFNRWSNVQPSDDANRARASIARGESLFNSKPINIAGVAGLNDELGLSVIPGTCTTCHDAPNVGNHSFPVPLNIGVGDLTSPLDLTYLPVITLRNKSTDAIVQTTDPGRVLITGKWKDIGKVKGPILRGLASRSPYFHNGSAAELSDVVEFYDRRFGVGFTVQDKADLVAFLSAL